MTKATTIPRNHTKKIEAAKEEVTRARLYRYVDTAIPTDVPLSAAWRVFEETPEAILKKIHFDGRATYVIEIQGGPYYRLTAA